MATAIGLGAGLGLVNVIFIAIGIDVLAADLSLQVAIWVLMFGFIPGGLAGAVLGGLAHAARDYPVWFRRILVIAPSIGVVFVLADMFDMRQLVYFASMPTVGAALILEVRTRAPVEPSPIPVARTL